MTVPSSHATSARVRTTVLRQLAWRTQLVARDARLNATNTASGPQAAARSGGAGAVSIAALELPDQLAALALVRTRVRAGRRQPLQFARMGASGDALAGFLIALA